MLAIFNMQSAKINKFRRESVNDSYTASRPLKEIVPVAITVQLNWVKAAILNSILFQFICLVNDLPMTNLAIFKQVQFWGKSLNAKSLMTAKGKQTMPK